MECSCEISGCDSDETYYECNETERILISSSQKLRCDECHKELKSGDKYEHAECYYDEYSKDDEEPNIHITCMDCLSLRNNFFSDWIYGSLWEDFEYHTEDCGGEFPEKCIAKLTPVAREKVCNIIEEYQEDSE